jgi:hypothetical protein
VRRRRRWLVATALSAVVAAAGIALPAGSAAAESNGGVRIMPLGDSITEGTQVPGGYRIGLWQRTAAAGYRVDLVGSQFNGPTALGDHDHEGHPGWRIDQIDANISGWLRSTSPRSVLDCHGGTNQQWTLNADGTIRGAQSGLCLDVDHNLTANGTVVLLWTCNAAANQRWSRV